jgi:hypothetical protein
VVERSLKTGTHCGCRRWGAAVRYARFPWKNRGYGKEPLLLEHRRRAGNFYDRNSPGEGL